MLLSSMAPPEEEPMPRCATASIPTPVLYGVSAFGSNICVYTFTSQTRSLSPELIPADRNIVTDVAPLDRWALDILDYDDVKERKGEGEAKLREVVATIKSMVANL
ncbi:hypothetical protein JOM56_004989 [Amanita muscaria]